MSNHPVVQCATQRWFGAYEFRCYRAENHGGDCEFPVDATIYQRRLDDYDAAWLASEVRVLQGRIASMKREAAADETPARLRRTIAELVHLAPANGSRKNIPAESVRAIWKAAVNGTGADL